MVSSYTTNKNIELPFRGDYPNEWDIPMNGDMNIIDSAFGGVTNLNATSGSANLSTAQYQKLSLNITGAMSANSTYTIPNGVGGFWIVRNATTDATGGPWTVRVASGGGGANVAIVRGRSAMVWSDGTNIRDVSENIESIGTVTSVNVSGGTTGLTTTGGPITTSGTITIEGTLGIANGGTGLTALGTNVANAFAANATGSGSMVLSEGSAAANATITTPTFGTPNFSVISANVTYSLSFPASNTAIVGNSTTQTLTNKRVTPRVSSAATSGSPFAWNSDNYDEYVLTALDTDLTISADSGTPTNGQKIIFSFTDTGVSRVLTWTTGVSKGFSATSVPLPITTTINTPLYVGFIYNSATDRWDCVASS